MPITIYYGPGGSYKTSSALIDFFVDAAFKGRTVYTNIRGLDDRDRAVEALEKAFPKGKNGNKKVPEEWELIHQQSEDTEGRTEWQTFFHRAPYGALIIIDEAQMIWRKELNASSFRQFDYPGGPEKAKDDNRPSDIRAAFEIHRHFNWDFVLTCQHLAQLHEMIRQTAEMAHKHHNVASILPMMKGHYVVRTHPADSYFAEKKVINQRNRVVKKWVFDLYESTATDEVTDTNVGISLWRNPAFAFPVAGIVGLFIYLVFFGVNPFAAKKEITQETEQSNAVDQTSSSVDLEGGEVSSSKAAKDSSASGDSLRFFELNSVTSTVWIVGDSTSRGFLFEVSGDDEQTGIILDQVAVEKLGYEITKYTSCLAKVAIKEEKQYVRCRGAFGKSKDKGVI
ncbi:MAG: hypothetical protein HQL69_19355 [Magnetococcales bacterium]|nr:hypothetical protein [Magnetococcales bacterium]